MMAESVDITFFVPCLNEESNIRGTIQTILLAANNVGVSFEILVFDDNSTDNTVAVVENLIAKDPEKNIVLKRNPKTLGLGRNYTDGAFVGKGNYYMLVNGDNVEPVEAIARILKQLGTADMVIPYFGNCDDRSFFRRCISITFTTMVNVLSSYSINYYNGPVAHKRFNVMRWHSDTEGFSYQAELIVRLLDEGATFTEVAISNHDREKGVSKAFTLRNILSTGYSLIKISLRRIKRVLFAKYYRSLPKSSDSHDE
jgi:glycosyltransferase involved in cell wall biosynthesis